MTALLIAAAWIGSGALVAAAFHLAKQRVIRGAAIVRSSCPCGGCGLSEVQL